MQLVARRQLKSIVLVFKRPNDGANGSYVSDINDSGIDINKSTTVLKFADDTKLFGICNNESDYLKLQEDVSKLESWVLA